MRLVDVQKKKKAIPIGSIGVALLAILVFVVSAFALDDMFGENWAYGSVPIASLCLYLGNVVVLNRLTYPEVRKVLAAEMDAMA